MATFWLVIVIGLVLAGASAVTLWRYGVVKSRPNSYMDGEGWVVLGSLFALCAVVAFAVLGINAVSRSVSKISCEKKDELTSGRYEWVDYHFFGYECLLRTPSGNITETPVFPIENVTEDR